VVVEAEENLENLEVMQGSVSLMQNQTEEDWSWLVCPHQVERFLHLLGLDLLVVRSSD
jgi:hypothetical protein